MLGLNLLLGLSLGAFTTLHVIISLVAIAAGLVVVSGWLRNRPMGGWTALFLATTILTSITGFQFPPKPIGPPHIFGFISLVLLAIALWALYGRKLAGAWRPVYIVTALITLFLNCVVGIVQSFQKVAFLHPLAPTGAEPPLLAAQVLLLVLFVVLGYLALKRFRPGPTFG
jgi:hypothetical protein